MSNPSIPLRFVAGLLFLILLFFLYLTLRWGVADYQFQQGYDVMQRWETEPPDGDTWATAHRHLTTALKLNPENPVYLQRLSRLYRIRWYWGFPGGNRASDGQLALQHLRESTRLRPHWAHGWAELALIKYLLEQKDEEFIEAFENAVVFGPWEPNTIYWVVWIGIRDFEKFDKNTQQLVIDTAARGLRSPAGKIYENTVNLLVNQEEIRSAALRKIVPHLSAKWRPSASYNFIRTLDWGWEEFTKAQQETIMPHATTALLSRESNWRWLAGIAHPQLKKLFCEDALVREMHARACKS